MVILKQVYVICPIAWLLNPHGRHLSAFWVNISTIYTTANHGPFTDINILIQTAELVRKE